LKNPAAEPERRALRQTVAGKQGLPLRFRAEIIPHIIHPKVDIDQLNGITSANGE
jgi:hypothetical protein